MSDIASVITPTPPGATDTGSVIPSDAPAATATTSTTEATVLTPAPAADASEFVTKADLASFFSELKAAVSQGSGAVSQVVDDAKNVVHLTEEEAPKVGNIVSHLGRTGIVTGIESKLRQTADGTSWTQYLAHVGIFAEHVFTEVEELGKL